VRICNKNALLTLDLVVKILRVKYKTGNFGKLNIRNRVTIVRIHVYFYAISRKVRNPLF